MATHDASFMAQATAFLGPTTFPVRSADKMNLQCRRLQTSHWKNSRREPATWRTRQESCPSPGLFIAPSRGKRCHPRGLLAFGLVGQPQKLPSLPQFKGCRSRPQMFDNLKKWQGYFVFHPNFSLPRLLCWQAISWRHGLINWLWTLNQLCDLK